MSDLRAFDRAPIGMFRSTESGQILYANEAFAKMLGYTLEEMLQLHARDLYADPAERARVIAKYVPVGVMDGVRIAARTKTGDRRAVRIWSHVRDPQHYDSWVVDITDLERQEAELQRTATTLDLMLSQLPVLFWLVDRDLKIVRTGGAIPAVLGYEKARYLDQTMERVHEDGEGAIDPSPYHRAALRGEHVGYTNVYRGKHLRTAIAPYRVDGEIVGAVGIAIDVSAERLLEQRMEDAQRAESLGMLAGGLAHDFNNLLVAILGNADLALREIAPDVPGRKLIEHIRTAGLRAAELTDQLLVYAGRGQPARTRVELRPLVDELLQLCAPMLAGANIRVDIPADLVLRGDPSHVRQVIMNLVGNARDAIAGRAGHIAITARVEHCGETRDDTAVVSPRAGAYARLEIADDGAGIPADSLHRIFEPFFTTKSTGHGLGLAAVLGIVRTHGGGLRVESDPEGTMFVVWWPLATSVENAVVAAPSASSVLVIDDEDLVRDVLARMIEDLGYVVASARDGASGLALVEQQAFDLVLVDMTMPRMSGAEVIAALRQKHPHVKVVLCSGYDRDGHGPVQADGYLPKPFRIDQLEQLLAKLLPRS